VQQEAFGGFAALSTQSVCSDTQQLPVEVSPEILCLSSEQQSSLALVVQVGAASALSEPLSPHVFVSALTCVDDLQHEAAGFGFAGPDDEQHELEVFVVMNFGGEQQESVGSCVTGAVEEQQDSAAFGSCDFNGWQHELEGSSFAGADVEQHDELGLASSAGFGEAHDEPGESESVGVEDEQHELLGFVVECSGSISGEQEAGRSESEGATATSTLGCVAVIASVGCSLGTVGRSSDLTADAAAFLGPQQPPPQAMMKLSVDKRSVAGKNSRVKFAI
jgi:hypothetical protein